MKYFTPAGNDVIHQRAAIRIFCASKQHGRRNKFQFRTNQWCKTQSHGNNVKINVYEHTNEMKIMLRYFQSEI